MLKWTHKKFLKLQTHHHSNFVIDTILRPEQKDVEDKKDTCIFDTDLSSDDFWSNIADGNEPKNTRTNEKSEDSPILKEYTPNLSKYSHQPDSDFVKVLTDTMNSSMFLNRNIKINDFKIENYRSYSLYQKYVVDNALGESQIGTFLPDSKLKNIDKYEGGGNNLVSVKMGFDQPKKSINRKDPSRLRTNWTDTRQNNSTSQRPKTSTFNLGPSKSQTDHLNEVERILNKYVHSSSEDAFTDDSSEKTLQFCGNQDLQNTRQNLKRAPKLENLLNIRKKELAMHLEKSEKPNLTENLLANTSLIKMSDPDLSTPERSEEFQKHEECITETLKNTIYDNEIYGDKGVLFHVMAEFNGVSRYREIYARRYEATTIIDLDQFRFNAPGVERNSANVQMVDLRIFLFVNFLRFSFPGRKFLTFKNV